MTEIREEIQVGGQEQEVSLESSQIYLGEITQENLKGEKSQ